MLYRFAECLLDTQLYTLERAGQRTRLAPKVFEVLCYLIAHRARVVSKQELCAQVWEGLAISDATLESCLRAVRLTVGDSGQAQRIIQTQRGYGYRFVAELDTLPEETSPPPLPPDAASLPLTSPPVFLGMRSCAACQHANHEDATFCEACGRRLRQPCARCGQDILLPAAFCPACGQSLVAPSPPGPVAPLAPAPALSQTAVTPPAQGGFGAERKLVTVLCSTVASPAAGGARFELDTLYSVMQELHALALEVVRPYGGHLYPTMGDRLLILFGVPTAQEDDARRAVRVARELQRRFQVHQERLEAVGRAPLAFRLGLHTGLVVVGSARDDAEFAAVVGDVVAVAMGLQEQAAPGQLLCSDTTARLIQGLARLEAMAPVQLPVQPTPIMSYAIVGGPGRRAPGWAHWERVLSPFVGRERELATLHALLAQVETGRGQMVGVVGEPGIGKSRLLYEFRQSLEGQRLTYLTGRCLSYGSTTPYLPVLDILRHNCGITDTDRPGEITAKVHSALQEVEMAPDAWAPVLLQLLGIQEGTDPVTVLDPETRKARTLAAVTQMCLNGSRRQPLILEMEDLHWIDASSEACLTELVERMAGAALLVLVTYRPGYWPPWVNKSYATQVSLQPLTRQDSLCVVQAVLPAAVRTAPLVPQVLAQAEGNPFFLEELARAVVEQGAEASSLTVPDTVQAVLTARMDRLPATAKRLLQAAAVIGKDVALPLLQAVTDASAEALHGDLRSLQAAEFFYEIYALTTPVYTFKHVLTQEVAYHSLVRRVRQHYHTRIAHVLEAQFPQIVETQPELLAYHYTEAGLTAPAIPYWQRAGRRAYECSAYVEAISYLTRGLELLQTEPDTPERLQQEMRLQSTLGVAYTAAKGYAAPEVEGAYSRARALCQQVGDTQQLFLVLIGLWNFSFVRGASQTACDLGEQLLTLAESTNDRVRRLRAHGALGESLLHIGHLRPARAHLEQGIALSDPQQRRSYAVHTPTVACLAYAAWALWHLGYPAQALQRMADARTLAEALFHPLSSALALHFSATLHQFRREPQVAQGWAEAAMTLAREQRLPFWDGSATILGSWALAAQGRSEEGLAQLHQGLRTFRATGAQLQQPSWLALLAEVHGWAGQAAQGLEAVAEALAIMGTTGERYYAAEVYRLQGELLWQAGSAPQVAETSVLHALTVARQEEAKSWELRAATSLARLWQHQGKRAAAYELLAPIYGWFTEGFDTADLQEAKALLEALG